MDEAEYLETYAKDIARACELLKQIAKEYYSPKIILAWERGGLFAPAWKDGGEIDRLWVNVIAHQCAVGVLAYRLSSRLENLIRDEGYSLKVIVEAALVHDSFKRREEENKALARQENRDLARAIAEGQSVGKRFIKKIGLDTNVVRIAGITGDKGLQLIRAGRAIIAEKIVFYADCCVSGDQIVGYKKRFDDLKPHFAPGGRYEGVDEIHLKKYGKKHREYWDEAVIPLEEELARLAKFPGKPEELYTI